MPEFRYLDAIDQISRKFNKVALPLDDINATAAC
tara:strand:- start:13535 stop:13636 length:102 start_codon:yes stop_codon:yes gene_type:complete